MTTHQFWLIVDEEDYAEFDSKLRSRKIFPRAAHEIKKGMIIVYFECTIEQWDKILAEWGNKYA